MIYTDISNFKKNVSSLIGQAIKQDEMLHVTTNVGSVIILNTHTYERMVKALDSKAKSDSPTAAANPDNK